MPHKPQKFYPSGHFVKRLALTSTLFTGGFFYLTHVNAQSQSASSPSPVQAISEGPAMLERLVRSNLGRILNPQVADSSLKNGIDALDSNDAAKAIAIRDAMPDNTPDRDILTWMIAMSGNASVPYDELRNSTKNLANWPGQTTLSQNVERALLRENQSSPTLIAAFKEQDPQTVAGRIALLRAYRETGETDKARLLLKTWWPTAQLSEKDERLILAEFSALLDPNLNRERFIRAIYAGRTTSAGIIAPAIDAQGIYQAAIAASRNGQDARKKLNNLKDPWKNDPLALYLRIKTLRQDKDYQQAAKLILKAPQDAKALVDPDSWWTERRIISRNLLDSGQKKQAYDVVANHFAETPAIAADAEFHAGWYALRMLQDPKLAARHFRKIVDISSQPISLSRANYWLGRAADAGSGDDAVNFYQLAASLPTTFYGQLAAERLGLVQEPLSTPQPNNADEARFSERKGVQAIKRLSALGYGWRNNLLYIGLADEIDSPGEMALLIQQAEADNNHYIALRVAKRAAARNLDIGFLTHPTAVIPNNADYSEAGMALAYAIARQESEFNSAAVSGADARGLLQLLPSTAKAVATRAGLDFNAARLTSDAAYNATLGSHYLKEQLKRLNGSYILTFASYNAGPRRVDQWIAQYGDPRGQSLEEVIDWIERIPYPETRNYVQRVMENYQTYKLRLNGKMDVVNDLVQGRKT